MPKQTMPLREKYKKEIVPALQKNLGLKNLHAIPKITTVRINVGIGSMVGAGKIIRVGGFNLSTLSSSTLGIQQGGLDTLMKPLFSNGEQGFATTLTT